MTELTFQKFKEICSLNKNKKHVEDCIDFITNDDCIFHPGIVMPKHHMADLYSFRLDLAMEMKKKSENELEDFGNCVAALKGTASKKIGLTTLYVNHFAFLIFYEPDTLKILGILKFANSSQLNDIEESNNDTINRGLSSNSKKYSKGKLIYDWNNCA